MEIQNTLAAMIAKADAVILPRDGDVAFRGRMRHLHVYFKKYRFKKDRLGRAVVLSEFGGYNSREEGHCFGEKNFGYKRFKTRGELFDAFRGLYEKEILPAIEKGLCAAVYTQLSDVEDEQNGLMTYDRKVVKMPADEVRKIFGKVQHSINCHL